VISPLHISLPAKEVPFSSMSEVSAPGLPDLRCRVTPGPGHAPVVPPGLLHRGSTAETCPLNAVEIAIKPRWMTDIANSVDEPVYHLLCLSTGLTTLEATSRFLQFNCMANPAIW